MSERALTPLQLFHLTQSPHTVRYTTDLVSKERMCWAIDILLSLQNPDGGFASYELIRGTRYMELINPAEVFVGLWAG